MTIKHLVVSGGGHSGLQAFGILQELQKKNIWQLTDIESIYATSAGAILSMVIALGFDMETIFDYIVLRPWHEAYNIKPLQIFNIFSKKGWFDISTFEIFYKPFFKAKDISLDITMKEFYEFTKIDCHFFAIEMNSFQVVDFSHTTHPDLPIIHAVYMSSSVPLLFIPICKGDQCFVDGGILSNYPLFHCLQRENIDINQILGIKKLDDASSYPSIIKEESSILEFTSCFIHHIMMHMKSPYETTKTLPNEISFTGKSISFQILKEMLYSTDTRKEWIESGYEIAKKWLQSL